jgi:hypothetical protein
MDRTRRFRIICNVLATLFVLVGAAHLATAFVPLADPLLSRAVISCDPCRIEKDPVFLIEPETRRRDAWRTPGMAERISRRAEQPTVRLMLFAAEAVRGVPFFVMFLALAMGLRSFGSSGFSAGAVRWLKRSAAAAIVWTLAQPLSQSIRWTAFAPVTDREGVVHIVFGGSALLWGVLIAGAVWISVRALEAALVLQQDLEDYV